MVLKPLHYSEQLNQIHSSTIIILVSLTTTFGISVPYLPALTSFGTNNGHTIEPTEPPVLRSYAVYTDARHVKILAQKPNKIIQVHLTDRCYYYGKVLTSYTTHCSNIKWGLGTQNIHIAVPIPYQYSFILMIN